MGFVVVSIGNSARQAAVESMHCSRKGDAEVYC